MIDNRDMLLTPGACSSELVLLRGNTRYVIVVVIQTLMRFGYWSSLSVRQEANQLRHTGIQIAHGLYGRQWTKMP
jgi:hypothetical protein